MRIGINVSWMTPGQAGGMEGYVRNLIHHLGILDQENEYVLVTAPNNYRTFNLPTIRWKKVIYAGNENIPYNYRILLGAAVSSQSSLSPKQFYRQLKSWWAQPRVSLKSLYHKVRYVGTSQGAKTLIELIKQEGIDLWFCPLIYALPLNIHVPVVTTIPDLQHEYFPDLFDEDERALRIMGYQYSCKMSTATIGISKYVADQISSLYEIDADRVFGIPLALDQSFQLTQPEIEHLVTQARLKFRLDQDFILYPANGWRHKNHENLVKALSIVRQQGGQVNLILTGATFNLMDRLYPLLHQYHLNHIVRHLGYVNKKDLIGLYGAAKMLIFPSRFEGFGLPLLEAMYLGIPVACSKVGSLPEVGGNAVCYFDPDEPENIAETILNVINDEDQRESLIAAGQEQVQRFNYTHTAKQTLVIFEKIHDGILIPPNLPSFRPLLPHYWLNEGTGRWYFHFPSLREIELTVIQPLALPQLENQAIEVVLDEKKVLESQIMPQHEYRFVIPSLEQPAGGFHRLDITALCTITINGEVLSVQIPSLKLTDTCGKKLSLIK